MSFLIILYSNGEVKVETNGQIKETNKAKTNKQGMRCTTQPAAAALRHRGNRKKCRIAKMSNQHFFLFLW